MSSVGGDQVQALNDLFSRSPEIDRLLHMQLVEKALKELSLDEAGAVALSSCISSQGSLSVEEKEWLQKILREKVWEMGVKSGRRPYQDYTALDSFLTDAVWDALQRGPFSSSSTILFQHVWSFGLAIAFRSYFSKYDCCVGILRQRAQESVCLVLHLEDCEEDVDIFCQPKKEK